MDSEDVPDLNTLAAPAEATDDGDGDGDELEGLLEDALEEALAEPQFEPEVLDVVITPARPGPSSLLAEHDFPRDATGAIDESKFSAAQRVAYNAAVIDLLTDEQLDRYEAFRRSSLRDPMRRLMSEVTGQPRPPNADRTLTALSSAAKTFVGELVEEARRVAEAREEHGALQTLHIHMAYQRLKERGLVETARLKARVLPL